MEWITARLESGRKGDKRGLLDVLQVSVFDGAFRECRKMDRFGEKISLNLNFLWDMQVETFSR